VRRQLQTLGVELGDEALHRELAKVDPETARRLPPGDRLRVIRALEIFRLTGQPASRITALPPGEDAQRPAYWLGLYRSRDEMYARAEQRIDVWLESGWLAEVEHLLADGLEPECPAFQALGYAHLVRYLREKGSWEQTVESIKRDTRRYIKRQGTWFRANPRITWVDTSDEISAWGEVQQWLSKSQIGHPCI
jgi:tRNA dimethylallyltransferase